MGADFGDEMGDWLLRKSTEWPMRYGSPIYNWLKNRGYGSKDMKNHPPADKNGWINDDTEIDYEEMWDKLHPEDSGPDRWDFDTPQPGGKDDPPPPTSGARPINSEEYNNPNFQPNLDDLEAVDGNNIDIEGLGREDLTEGNVIVFNCADTQEASKAAYALNKAGNIDAHAYGNYCVADHKGMDALVNNPEGHANYTKEFLNISHDKDLLNKQLGKNKKVSNSLNAQKRATKQDITKNINEASKHKVDKVRMPSKAKEMGQIMTK